MTPDPALQPTALPSRMRYGRAEPTRRQIYTLAAELCERMGEEFPQTRLEASETIERLRIENGHPQPRLEDTPFVPSRRGRRR